MLKLGICVGYTLGARLGIIDGDHVGVHVGLVGFKDTDGEAVVGIVVGGDDTVGTIDGLYDGKKDGLIEGWNDGTLVGI